MFARRQLILADRIVLSKTDIADEEAVTALSERVRELNPRARLVSAVQGALDPNWLIERGPLDALGQSEMGAGFIAEDAEASHTDNIRSFTLTENAPVAWEPFARAMETLIALRGEDLLRVKGIVDVEGCRGPVVVQFVQHLAHPPIEMETWPEGPRLSRIVFITRGVGERQVRDLFAAVKALAAREH